MVNVISGQIDIGSLISLMGFLITILFIHFNSSARTDAVNARLDSLITKMDEKFDKMHQEIMSIKKS